MLSEAKIAYAIEESYFAVHLLRQELCRDLLSLTQVTE